MERLTCIFRHNRQSAGAGQQTSRIDKNCRHAYDFRSLHSWRDAPHNIHQECILCSHRASAIGERVEPNEGCHQTVVTGQAASRHVTEIGSALSGSIGLHTLTSRASRIHWHHEFIGIMNSLAPLKAQRSWWFGLTPPSARCWRNVLVVRCAAPRAPYRRTRSGNPSASMRCWPRCADRARRGRHRVHAARRQAIDSSPGSRTVSP